MQINLPPGVSEERMSRMSREHDPKSCEAGNNGERCSECQSELDEAKYDAYKETRA